jgi:hypothetical protein
MLARGNDCHLMTWTGREPAVAGPAAEGRHDKVAVDSDRMLFCVGSVRRLDYTRWRHRPPFASILDQCN